MSDTETPMTVGELRALLAGLPEDTPVFVCDDEFGTYRRPEANRVTLEMRATMLGLTESWRHCECHNGQRCDHLNAVSLS